MKNELNYPIKYAVMPIYEQVGWVAGLNELNRQYDIVANIVSKCYVVSEKKEYYGDGNFKITYNVVFPFQKLYHRVIDKYDRELPDYNFNYECINSTIVYSLYDNFEDANEATNEANEKIYCKSICGISMDKDVITVIDKIKKEHQTIIEKYKKIEKMIEFETNDMIIDSHLVKRKIK